METKNGKCFSSQIYIIIWSFRAQIIYLVFYATDYPMLFPMSFPPLLCMPMNVGFLLGLDQASAPPRSLSLSLYPLKNQRTFHFYH